MTKTAGEEIEDWKKKYAENDTVGKYLMSTVLLLNKFEIEEEIKWLETQPKISREEYLKALHHRK